MQRFDLDEAVSFEWGNASSRPLLDAFEGGAVVITKNGVESFSTSQWLDAQIKNLASKQEHSDRDVPKP